MGSTKSEKTAREAFESYDEGNLRDCIHTLVEYADRHVNNFRTEAIFHQAIDTELAQRGIGNVNQPDPDAPGCVHCGNSSTYHRVTDGDIGCNNCHGIMPQNDNKNDEEGVDNR